MRQRLTDKGVRSLRPREKAYAKPDPELVGHWVRVQPSGTRAFYAVTRNPEGRQVWTKTEATLIADSREQAREILRRVRAGLPAREPRTESLRRDRRELAQAASRGERGALGEGDQPAARRARLAGVARSRTGPIRRTDIAALLDKIEDGHGAHAADASLTVVRSVMSWYATHTITRPPIVKGHASPPAAYDRARPCPER